MSDQKIIFSMNRVNKSFASNNKQVLKNINLSFFYGAKIGIIGLNGSGKSTLLKIIAGLDKSFQGDVHFSNDYSIGYLEQEPALDDNLSKNTWGRSRLEVSNKFQFRRSFHYKSSLPSGHKVSLKDLRFVRPCDGIGYDQINDILEKKLTKSVNSFDPCLLEDFEK